MTTGFDFFLSFVWRYYFFFFLYSVRLLLAFDPYATSNTCVCTLYRNKRDLTASTHRANKSLVYEVTALARCFFLLFCRSFHPFSMCVCVDVWCCVLMPNHPYNCTIPFARIQTQANREPAHWLPCGRTFLMASHENGMRCEWQTHRRHCAQSIFRCCVYWIHTFGYALRACTRCHYTASVRFARTKYLHIDVLRTFTTRYSSRLRARVCASVRTCVCVCGEHFLLVASWDQQFCAFVVLQRRHCCCVYARWCVRAFVFIYAMLDQMAIQLRIPDTPIYVRATRLCVCLCVANSSGSAIHRDEWIH